MVRLWVQGRSLPVTAASAWRRPRTSASKSQEAMRALAASRMRWVCSGLERTRAQGSGESIDVADGEDEAFNAVGDEVGVRADVVGDDDGAAGGHGLVDDEAPGLVAGGEDEDVGEREEGGELRLIAEAKEADAFEGQLACAGFEACRALRRRRR